MPVSVVEQVPVPVDVSGSVPVSVPVSVPITTPVSVLVSTPVSVPVSVPVAVPVLKEMKRKYTSNNVYWHKQNYTRENTTQLNDSSTTVRKLMHEAEPDCTQEDDEDTSIEEEPVI